MTALDKFIRLEAIGQWRPSPDAELQEVVVSFGNATLQLTKLDDTPLSHWALRAVRRVGSKGRTIIYSADSQGDETLLIDDADMNRAIAAMTFEIGRAQPRQGNMKKYAWLGVLLAAIGLLSQSPPLIYNWAVKLTSPLRMQEFSEAMRSELFDIADYACRDNRAASAMSLFSYALFEDFPPIIFIMKVDTDPAAGLSNAIIFLPLETVLTAQNPEELAAIVAVNYAMSDRRALLRHSLESAGPLEAIQHIFGQNITPNVPESFPSPAAEDFVKARDRLQTLQIDTYPLQELAAKYEIGLPINGSAITQPFAARSFTAIQRYCQL